MQSSQQRCVLPLSSFCMHICFFPSNATHQATSQYQCEDAILGAEVPPVPGNSSINTALHTSQPNLSRSTASGQPAYAQQNQSENKKTRRGSLLYIWQVAAEEFKFQSEAFTGLSCFWKLIMVAISGVYFQKILFSTRIPNPPTSP